jgi:hypothetical protein
LLLFGTVAALGFGAPLTAIGSISFTDFLHDWQSKSGENLRNIEAVKPLVYFLWCTVSLQRCPQADCNHNAKRLKPTSIITALQAVFIRLTLAHRRHFAEGKPPTSLQSRQVYDGGEFAHHFDGLLQNAATLRSCFLPLLNLPVKLSPLHGCVVVR